MSIFSPNLQFEEVARNADIGVWDTPTNANWALVDSVVGNITTIGLNNANVVLSAPQFQSKTLTFNSTLTGSVIITFPTSFTKSYEIQNLCTGSSAFTITLETTATGGQVICVPPGETIDCFNDGSNLKYKNLGRIGTYWDYAGSSVPAWVSGCTTPPYLNCDGTTFSAATYPALAVVLGSTTLPNSKGKTRFVLDQGAGLISSAATGFSGSVVGGTGGAQTTTLVTGNLPAYTPTGSGSGFIPGAQNGGPFTNQFAYGGGSVDGITFPVGLSMNAQGGTSTPLTNLPPAYIGGLTLIRAG